MVYLIRRISITRICNLTINLPWVRTALDIGKCTEAAVVWHHKSPLCSNDGDTRTSMKNTAYHQCFWEDITAESLIVLEKKYARHDKKKSY